MPPRRQSFEHCCGNVLLSSTLMPERLTGRSHWWNSMAEVPVGERTRSHFSRSVIYAWGYKFSPSWGIQLSCLHFPGASTLTPELFISLLWPTFVDSLPRITIVYVHALWSLLQLWDLLYPQYPEPQFHYWISEQVCEKWVTKWMDESTQWPIPLWV